MRQRVVQLIVQIEIGEVGLHKLLMQCGIFDRAFGFLQLFVQISKEGSTGFAYRLDFSALNGLADGLLTCEVKGCCFLTHCLTWRRSAGLVGQRIHESVERVKGVLALFVLYAQRIHIGSENLLLCAVIQFGTPLDRIDATYRCTQDKQGHKPNRKTDTQSIGCF